MVKPTYYVLDDAGEPLAVDDVLVWASWFETADRHVADTQIGDVRVSTVFLGLDHRFIGGGPPILYETLVFGGVHDGDMKRYTSRDRAVEGHAAIVATLLHECGQSHGR